MMSLLHSAILALILLCSQAQASSYHVPLVSPAIPSFSKRSRSSQRGRRLHTVLLASSKSKSLTAKEARPLISPISPPSAIASSVPKWEDLPLQWKVIFGAVEIVYTVGTQWVSGFATAYLFGSITGIPLLVKPPSEGVTRFARFNQKNIRWGKSWGSISGSFSGFDTGVRLVRNNKVDEWNSLIGSACAGAFFVRAQGPAAMAKSAALYAGFGYFVMRAGQKKEFVEEVEL